MEASQDMFYEPERTYRRDWEVTNAEPDEIRQFNQNVRLPQPRAHLPLARVDMTAPYTC